MPIVERGASRAWIVSAPIHLSAWKRSSSKSEPSRDAQATAKNTAVEDCATAHKLARVTVSVARVHQTRKVYCDYPLCPVHRLRSWGWGATLRPLFSPLFTRVRGRRVLRSWSGAECVAGRLALGHLLGQLRRRAPVPSLSQRRIPRKGGDGPIDLHPWLGAIAPPVHLRLQPGRVV
jgi:hypothetical protein